MPVPVQCPQCSKKLNVPDKYRGKGIKCPGCQNPLKVPGGQKKAAAARARSRKPQPVAAPDSDADFLAGMNLGGTGIADASVQICPKCATELSELDANVCPECGHNLLTGQLDERVAKKRARGGEDPSVFYKTAFPDGWAFAKRDLKMATRTAFVWALFGTLAFIFYACLQNSERGPIVTFFTFLTLIASFAVGGWYWFLSLKVVEVTMQKEDRIKRFHVDVFQTLALGVRAVLWPVVTSAPILVPIAVWWYLTEGDSEPSLDSLPVKIGLAVYALTYTLFPIAQAHMNARYSYRASVLWELLKAVPANIGQLVYWNVCALLLLGPFAALFWLLEAKLGGGNLFRNETLYGWAKAAGGLIGAEGQFLYNLTTQVTAAILCFVGLYLITLLAGIPAVMLMRITGRFALLRKNRLNLMSKAHRGDPAGFWVRYVAATTDLVLFPFGPLIAGREKALSMIGLLMMALAILALVGVPAFIGAMKPILVPVYLIIAMWIYFSVLESGSARATIGKENVKLVAETDRGRQKTLGQAMAHWMMSVVMSPVFFLVAFDKNHRSIADKMAGCRVVWKGDD